MTTEVITFICAIVNALVSVMLEVVPNLKDKWSGLKYKPLILLGFALVVPVALWALSCYGGLAFIDVVCSWQGAFQMFVAGFVAFLVNQTAFSTSTRKLPNVQARVVKAACVCEEECQ